MLVNKLFRNLALTLPKDDAAFDHCLFHRFMIVSREAKKNQRLLSEFDTGNTAKKLGSALAKPPRQLASSYYSPRTFLQHRISKPTMVEISATVLKYWPMQV